MLDGTSEDNKARMNGDVPIDGEAGIYDGKDLDEVLALAEVNSNPPLSSPPKCGNNRVLAQVLGFKFRHYQVRAILTIPWSI